jgi:hypothetical protein
VGPAAPTDTRAANRYGQTAKLKLLIAFRPSVLSGDTSGRTIVRPDRRRE